MVIDIDLVDTVLVSSCRGESVQNRQLNAAWAAPGRPEIDQHRLVVLNGLFKRGGVEFGNHDVPLPA